ncbi:hypothetical protein CFP71_40630 [Amycolatopsis thailandensis]|uniref:Uncharacterized protein n=1 Tax=Amycolatopsis thailandensis TaxID=589330 RepID=A0A229RC77_9PSEU|nr:hypothetical protein [Amycolatopsis thailandensis]OXM44262.1 hypothetical protein CFP71_40630 [Amycolatopsis thailandensis]
MTTGPALRQDDLLIVVEGAARLSWIRTGPARWRPSGLWPTREQEAEIAEHVGSGAPLLVVLAEMPTIVPLLTEELIDAPEDLVKLADFTGYLSELRIPFLGWLPPELRERGRRFFEATGARPARPLVLRSPLIVEPAVAGDYGHVRFARWLDAGHPPIHALIPAARRVFSGAST